MGEFAMLERVIKGGLLVGRSLHERQGRAICDRNGHVIFLALVSAKPAALAYRTVIGGERFPCEWDVNYTHTHPHTYIYIYIYIYIYTGCTRKDVAVSFIYQLFDLSGCQKLERNI